MMRQVARATARLVPWCLICLLFSQNGSVSSSELNNADSAFVNNYLPDCTNNNNNNNENSKSNLFIVSTLEGKLSVIDGISGILKWSKQITSGPLLSSSISDFMVNNKGEIVRIVPSLDGNLFVHNGRTIKQTPFSTEKLLKSSLKFSENVLLVGGQENQIVGLNLEDGSVTYECGFKGCSQVENMTFEDVVLLKKTSQSVRAINSLNGKEEWHFVVNDPQLLNVARQHCHNGQSNGQPKYSVDFKVIVPSGLIYSSVYYLDELATKQLYKEWDLKFDSPIVNVWHYEQGKLEQVNLFNRKTIGISRMYVDQNGKEHTITSDQEQLKLLNEENTLDEGNLSEPDFYIGSNNNQLYIQKSPFQKSQTSLLAQSEDNELSDLSDQNTAIVQVEWKQPSASTVGEDTATGGDASKKLADKFEISAKLSFPFSQKLNSTGYYIFKLNHSSESNKCERIAGTEELTTIEHETENIINEIVYTSLSYYWKEIVAICLISWVVLNFFTLIFKNYALEPIKNYLWPTNGEMDTGKNKESWEKSEAPVGESSTAVREASSSGGGNEASENLTYNSRYKQDFDQISLLGKGGFGLVFECKHKIDESLYAVKRISIPAEQEKRERFMREIRVLSKLNHSGIVRYYNAWIEEPPVGWQEQQDQLHHIDFTQCSSEDCSQTENGESQLSLDQSRPTRSSSSLGKTYQSNTSLEIVFKDKSCEQDTDDEEKKDKAAVWSDGDCGHKSSDNCDRSSSNCETKCLEEEEDEEAEEEVATSVHLHESVRSKQPSAKVYVYIQMQLCRKETLKDWLLENKDRDKHQVLNIFLQLIDAVHYVHSNKLIHRDLKPSNIFFSMDGLIKIGDFGLVTNTVEDHFEPDTMEDESQKRLLTNNVGTQLYMSPEQIKKKPYDHKVDIFSLGIILYELLQSFNTEYERILTLNSVRNMKFPPEFTERHSEETQILQRLLSLIPNERPEASDLLSEDIFSKAKQVT